MKTDEKEEKKLKKTFVNIWTFNMLPYLTDPV